MTFRVSLSGQRLDETDDPREITAEFLYAIGYITLKKGHFITSEETYQSVPFRLFFELLLPSGSTGIDVQKAADALGTSKPTCYRYINKLREMDMIEDIGQGVRIRYGSLTRAMEFLRLNTQLTLELYAKTARTLDSEFSQESYDMESGMTSFNLTREFQFRLDANIPDNVNDALHHILQSLNILSDKGSIDKGVKTGLHLFSDCLLKHSGRYWNDNQISAELGIKSATVRKFLMRMASADILEYSAEREYRLRGGSLSRALETLSAYHVPTILDRYSETAEKLDRYATSL